MGRGEQYRCVDCGHDFSARTDFSYGRIVEVFTAVVCPDHGLTSAMVGINVARGELLPNPANPAYPCPQCGVMAPRWDRKSCPQCGSGNFEVTAIFMSD